MIRVVKFWCAINWKNTLAISGWFAMFAVFTWLNFYATPALTQQVDQGVVISAGPIEGGDNCQITSQAATVRLRNGRVINAEVESAIALQPGSVVQVHWRVSSCGSGYQVVPRN